MQAHDSGIIILHEDRDLLVIDKRSGDAVLADRGGGPSLLEILKDTHPGLLPVHRLDKGTSGVMLLAKSPIAQASLNRQFQARTINKFYVALVSGCPEPSRALIDLPLVKGRKNSYRIAAERSAIGIDMGGIRPEWRVMDAARMVKGGGLPSQTHYRVLRRLGSHSLVLLKPVTGRTHQIRVHMGWIGYPLLGDSMYNKDPELSGLSSRLSLHCHRISWLDTWSNPASPTWRSIRRPTTVEELLGR